MEMYYILLAFCIGSFLGFFIGGFSAGSRILNLYDEIAELKTRIVYLENDTQRDVSTQTR
jgi:hypothetical protein